MENPLQKLIPKDTETGSDPNGMRGRIEMNKEADKALHPESTAAPATNVAKPAGPFKIDKVTGRAPYGSKPGEKPPEAMPWLKEATKPLGQMHKGGTIPQTGAYVMKAGEKVLTPEQHGHLKGALSLAQSALSHEPEEDKKPVKVVKEMHIRPTANGGFIAKHIHAGFDHPDEEHVHPHIDALHDHMEEHWGEPNDGEYESENEKDESPGVKAAEETVGLK